MRSSLDWPGEVIEPISVSLTSKRPLIQSNTHYYLSVHLTVVSMVKPGDY